MNSIEFWSAVIGAGKIIVPVITIGIVWWLMSRKKKQEEEE